MQAGKGAPSKENLQTIAVDKPMTLVQRQAIVDTALATHDQDAEKFLQTVAERMARCAYPALYMQLPIFLCRCFLHVRFATKSAPQVSLVSALPLKLKSARTMRQL